MLKARCDLGANVAARPQESPGAIQAIRDRVFRPKWHVALTAVDALTNLPALQGDVIIHQIPHDSIVAPETITTQGLTVRKSVYEEERLYRGPDYHIEGLQQLLRRYITGRKRRGLVIVHFRSSGIATAVQKVRLEMDTRLPLDQQGPTLPTR